MTARLALALGRSEWESRLVAHLVHPSTDVVVTRRCVDGDDARAALTSRACDAVVVSDTTSRIDAAFIDLARAHGVRVLAVSDDQARWTALGVREVFPLHGTDVLTCGRTIVAALALDAVPVPERRGTGVLVSGFGGAAGRTSVVRELAFALAALDGSARVLMADADVYGPSLAQQMRIHDAGGGLLEACRAMESAAAHAPAPLATTAVGTRVDVLPGLARATRWVDLRAPHLEAVWRRCLVDYSIVVADAGPVLEPDLAGPTGNRGAAVHTVLAQSDAVVLCCRADTVGVARLVRGYAECESLLDDKHITVVVVGADGRGQAKDVEHAVVRLTGLQSIAHVPFRRDAFARAEREGGYVSARDKDIARAFDNLARVVLPSRVLAPRPVSTRAIDDYLRPRAA